MIPDYSKVKVAVRVRPQSTREKSHLNKICTKVIPPSLFIGPDKQFTYDHVFDINESQEIIFDTLAKPLIDGCLEGFNATLLAYGQTGSGKTYTMGTGYDPETVAINEVTLGIVPRAVCYLFSRVQQLNEAAIANNLPAPEFQMVAHYIELYNENFNDLLGRSGDGKSSIRIHEDSQGGIYLTGMSPRSVSNYEETMKCLRDGSLSRSIGSTNMNAQSSRSHAIFTLHMKLRQLINKDSDADLSDINNYRVLSSKFHFVDLAGSERLGRTGATGDRKKEGISINVGLLALGNVISALGDRQKIGSHVPYRDSKLTRVLQDSLGGNSRTIMIACVSPSDCDFCETISTLSYANRARNIKNRVVVNQDKSSKEISALKSELEALRMEVEEYRQGRRVAGSGDTDKYADMHNEILLLKQENNDLVMKVKVKNEANEMLKSENATMRAEKDLQNWLSYKKSVTDTDISDDYEMDEISKITEKYSIEKENLRTELYEAHSEINILKRSYANAQDKLASNTPNRIAISRSEFPTDEFTPTPRRGFRRTGQENVGSLSEPDIDSRGSTDSELYGQFDDDKAITSDTDSYQADSDNSDENDPELIKFTSKIDEKEKLLREIHFKEREINKLKVEHETSVRTLQMKIKQAESERDKMVSELESVESTTEEKVRKTKEEYSKRILNLNKQLQTYKDEKSKLIVHMNKQLELKSRMATLEREVTELKRCKVECSKRLKEEAKRSRDAEISHNKEVVKLRKEKRLADNQIRTLQHEKQQRDTVLRRKNEEEQLRRKNAPYNVRGVMVNSCQGSIATSTPTANKQKISHQRRLSFITARNKKKWDEIFLSMRKSIKQECRMRWMERDLKERIKERENLCYHLEYARWKQVEKDTDDIKSEIRSIETQIDMFQTDIMDLQKQIGDIENGRPDLTSLRFHSSEELLYIIDKLVDLHISSSSVSEQKEKEFVSQLEEKAYENNNNRNIIEQLMQQLNILPPDIEDMLRVNNYQNEDDNSDHECTLLDGSDVPLFEKVNRIPFDSNKTTRQELRTSPPEDTLGHIVDSKSTHHQINNTFNNNNRPLLKSKSSIMDRMVMSMDDSQLMPPPKNENVVSQISTMRSQRSRPNSMTQSFIVLPQEKPSLKGRLLSRKSRSFRESTNDVSPPSTPTLRRMNSYRQSDANVFNRLTVPSSSPSVGKGAIQPYQRPSSRPTSMRETPLECTHVTDGHKKPVIDLHVSASIMVTGSKDRTAKVWDLKTMSELATLSNHISNVVKVRHVEANHLILTVSSYFVKVWDDRNMKCVKTVQSNGLPFDDIPDSQVMRQPNYPPAGQANIIDLVVSDNGDLMFTAAGNSVRMWDLRTFSSVGKLQGNHQAQVMVLAQGYKRDDPSVLNIVTGSKDHCIKIFTVASGAQAFLNPTSSLQPPHYDGIEALALHDDVLFSGSRDACIKKWDISTSQQTTGLNNAHNDWIQGLAISSDGRNMFSGCRSGVLKLWNVKDCSLLGEVKAHDSSVNAVTCFNDRVFTASNDSTVKFWSQAQD